MATQDYYDNIDVSGAGAASPTSYLITKTHGAHIYGPNENGDLYDFADREVVVDESSGGYAIKTVAYWYSDVCYYVSYNSSNDALRLRKFDPSDETSSTITEYDDASVYDEPCIALDSANGLVYWGYSKDSDGKFYTRKYTISSTTDASYQNRDNTCNNVFTMGVDSNGKLHIRYQTTGGALTWDKYDGGWSNVDNDTIGNGAVGYNAFVYDADNFELYNYDKSKSWTLPVGTGDRLTGEGLYVFDSDGYPYTAVYASYDISEAKTWLYFVELNSDQSVTEKSSDEYSRLSISGLSYWAYDGVLELSTLSEVLWIGGYNELGGLVSINPQQKDIC